MFFDINWQTSGESASLPQYLGCNTVFDMRLGNLDCHFLCRKKCGNLNFIIFIGKKSSESWTLSFLLVEKARKVELDHF
jgi:hypothetical protein